MIFRRPFFFLLEDSWFGLAGAAGVEALVAGWAAVESVVAALSAAGEAAG